MNKTERQAWNKLIESTKGKHNITVRIGNGIFLAQETYKDMVESDMNAQVGITFYNNIGCYLSLTQKAIKSIECELYDFMLTMNDGTMVMIQTAEQKAAYQEWTERVHQYMKVTANK